MSVAAAFNMDPMIRLESGGNPRAVNDRPQRDGRPPTYATGLRQFMPAALQMAGVYQPAGDRGWGGTFNIPGFAGVRTREDFMANPEAQEAAYTAHRAHLMREIQRRGLGRFVGQTVGGVPIDENALIHAMHFAGPGGATRFLESGGTHNPSDGNLRVTEYLMRTAGGGGRPAPAAPQAPAGPSQNPVAPILANLQAQQGEAPLRTGPTWQDALLGLAQGAASFGLARAFR
jgi:hypothetical protein